MKRTPHIYSLKEWMLDIGYVFDPSTGLWTDTNRPHLRLTAEDFYLDFLMFTSGGCN